MSSPSSSTSRSLCLLPRRRRRPSSSRFRLMSSTWSRATCRARATCAPSRACAGRRGEELRGREGLRDVALDWTSPSGRGGPRRSSLAVTFLDSLCASLCLLSRSRFSRRWRRRSSPCLPLRKKAKRAEEAAQNQGSNAGKRKTHHRPSTFFFLQPATSLKNLNNSAAAADDNIWRKLCERFPGPGVCEPSAEGGDSSTTWKELYA